MTSTGNRESTNKLASPKKHISDVNTKVFTCQQAQAATPINEPSNLIDKNEYFQFTDSKVQKQINYDYHH